MTADATATPEGGPAWHALTPQAALERQGVTRTMV